MALLDYINPKSIDMTDANIDRITKYTQDRRDHLKTLKYLKKNLFQEKKVIEIVSSCNYELNIKLSFEIIKMVDVENYSFSTDISPSREIVFKSLIIQPI